MSVIKISQEILDIKKAIEQKTQEINELIEQAKKIDSKLNISFQGTYSKKVIFNVRF